MELSKKKISKIMKQKNQSRKKMNKKTNRKKKNYKKSFRKGKSFNLRNKTLKHKIKLHGGKMENNAKINILTREIEDDDNEKIQTEINDLKLRLDKLENLFK